MNTYFRTTYMVKMFLTCMVAVAVLFSAGCTKAPASPAVPTATEKGQSADSAVEPEGPADMMKNGRGIACTEIQTLTEESLRTLKDNGITFVKIHIPYPYDSAGNLANNYLSAKKTVRMISECGLEPVCQSFTPGGNAYNSGTGQIEWISYLPNVFEDYDDDYFYKVLLSGSEYIAKDLKKYCNCWIVSNEPNLSVFTGPMTTTQIVKYINTCAEGIKNGNSDAYCGVNIFGSANMSESMHLVQKLYDSETNLDWLGLDSYFGTLVAGSPEDWEDYIDTFYNIAHVPIIVTEFSYSSYIYDSSLVPDPSLGLRYNSPVCRDKKFSFEWQGHERGEEAQAEYARICLEIFEKHEEVIGYCWFSNMDKDGPCWECGDPGCPMESSWGLLHSDGTPKPVLNVFKDFAES